MVRPAIRRTLLAAAVLLLAPLGLAAPAEAAKPASVTITSPANGSSGPADVSVAGKATLPPLHSLRITASTLGDSVNARPDSRGAWSVRLTDLILGETTICADIYDSGGGYVTGACTRYTVVPTPARFTLDSPTEGAQVNSPLEVRGQCEYGEFITITTDVGAEWATTCEFYTRDWVAPLTVPFGPVTITATAQGLDGSVVATRTVRVTVVPLATPDVEVLDPVAGQTLYVDRVATVSGTATGTDYVQVTANDVGIGGAVPLEDGTWSIVFFPEAPGPLRICAAGSNADGSDEDCVDVAVTYDPDVFGVSDPADDLLTSSADVAVSGSCADGTDVTAASDAAGATPVTVPCENGNFSFTLVGLPEGTQTVTVSMTSGGEVIASRARTVTVDTIAPAQPVITSPAPGSTITSVPVTLTGTSEPGSRVEVLLPDEMSYVETTADANGRWTAVLQRDYFEYAGVLTGKRATLRIPVRSTDAAGNGTYAAVYTYTVRAR